MGIIGKLFSDSVADGIGGAIIDGIRSLCYAIDEFIYRAIIYLYDLFLTLCNGEILDLTLVQEISKRIGFILGTIMLFMVLISFLQMILNPEKANDKEQGVGNIVKKIIIVVVMLGLAPRFFSLTYDVQKILLGQNKNNTNVIQNVILPYKISNPEKFGANLSLNLFNSLYYIDENSIAYSGNGGEICQAYMELLRKNVISDSDYSAGSYCVNVKAEKNLSGSSETEKVYLMHFDYLISVLAGGFIVYILMIYCIKVGIRMIQLAFLQIISPMAFVSYLAPKKDTMFTRWKNMYISTYLDVFIRVAIISLVVLMISLLFQKTYTLDGVEQSSTFWQSIESSSVGTVDMNNSWVSNLTNIIMIIALLQFGKRAPELLKEILPKGGSGSIGFGLGKKDNEGFFKALGFGRKTARFAAGVATGTAVGIIGGAAGGRGLGRATGALWEGLTGAVRGGSSGMKSKNITGAISDARKRQAQTNIARAQRIANNVSWIDDLRENAARGLGIDTSYEKLDREIALLESENAAYNQFDAYFDAAQKRLDGQIEKGVYNDNVHAANALREKNLAAIYRQQSANVKENDFLKYYDRTGQELEYHSTIENGEKFEWLTDANGGVVDFDDAIQRVDRVAHQQKLNELADLASQAESAYINEMKAAKKDIITGMLNGSGEEIDQPTMQNLQQAAGVIDANATNGFDAFKGITGEDLLKGDFDMFDKLNGEAKGKIAENNNRIAEQKVRNQAGKIYKK